jgi:MoxR-like ATPase
VELSARPLRETKRDLALFVDRQELDTASRALEHHGNVLILGSRGIGKSSLLAALSRRLRNHDVPVLSVNGRVAGSAVELLTLLRAQLVADDRGPPLGAASRALQVELRALRASLEEPWTVALVDEVNSPEVAHTLFGRLRDELWELPLGWAVAADERARANYLEPPADAFWRRVLTLPPLSRSESEELVRRRVPADRLPEDVLGLMVEEAGGNPRRLLAFAYDVLVDNQDPQRLVDNLRERESRRTELSKPARRLLAELEAAGPAGPSDEALLRRLGWSRSRASQVFSELEANGFVRADERPSKAGRRPRRIFALER